MTIGEAEIKISSGIQAIYDADEAKAIARLVLCNVCNFSSAQLMLRKNDLLDKKDEQSVSLIINDLLTGKPVQYILEETTFFGLHFKVNPTVLIPRPETEELVEWILKECRARSGDEGGNSKDDVTDRVERILDIGTGSGCIPIALKKHLPAADVWGLDISRGALQIAEENAVLNHVDVHFVQADIRHAVENSGPLFSSRFTVIVSNPPYITQSEKEQMHQNVLNHEPHTALFVPDNDPLLFYKAIAGFSRTHLADNGLLFLEINEKFGEETVSLLRSAGFKNCVVKKDLQGKDRMIMAKV